MNISYLLKYLWRKKWLIIIPTLLTFILAWFFTRHMQQTYTSVAELSTGYMEVNPLENTNRSNNSVLFNNVIQTLKSNHILDEVSFDLLLHDLKGNSSFRTPSNKFRYKEILAKYPGGKHGLETTIQNKADSFHVLDLTNKNDRLIGELAGLYGYSPDAILGNVQINRVEGSDFISISTTTENPTMSAFISNAICRNFLMYFQNMQGLASTSSLDTLKKIMDTKKQLLDNKLKLLQGNNDLTTSNSMGLIASLQGQLIQQKNNLIAAQVALNNVNKQISEANKQGGGLANNEDIIDLRSNIDNLWAKYVNGGSNDANLLDQINNLRSDLQHKLSAAGTISGGTSVGDLMKEKMDLDVKVNVANQTMKDLQAKINSLNSAVQSSSSQEGVISGIQNEIEASRQDYLAASKLYNEALNRNIFPGNNFKQTLIASPPLTPNPSKKSKVLGFATAGVFFVLIFLFLFFEFIDPSIKTPSYLKENIPLPLLTNIQRLGKGKYPVHEIFNADGSLPPYQRAFREQVKQLRYEVENSGNRIFLVTGYHEGSGRTTLIQALAASLSLTDKRILLIDANFRNNTLTQIYHATPSLQTFQFNEDSNGIKQKIMSIITATSDKNISVIGCERGDNTPDEVLPDKNVLTWLKHNDAGFDYIFIDCAALSKGPDSKELIKYIDAAILLFAADQELTEEDRKLADFLKKDHINMLGTVLNRVNADNINL